MKRFAIMDWMDGWTGHSLSIAALLGSAAGFIPPVAALASFVWFCVQIYESRTFQHWKRNRQMKSRARKLAKLRAREKVTLAEIAALERVRHARREAIDMVEGAKAEAAQLLVKETTDNDASSTPPRDVNARA